MSTHVLKPPKLRRYHILESISSKTFIPREYQVELLDTARKKNTIICLGTGTGKTFVAVMLIKELSHQIRKPPSQGGKRTVFLAPTVPLVRQQAKVVSDCTDLVVGQYFGSETDWTKELWLKEIENHQVLIMTPDIFKMILHHGFMPLSTLNLIIFDECHRAVKNHPYCEIMKCFDTCLPENQPQILGLSASLINSKCQPSKIEKEILCLERNLMSSVETASELTSLSKYGSKPKEYLIEYCTFLEDESTIISIMSNINNALVFLDNVNISYESFDFLSHPCRQPRRYLIELAHVVVNLGPWCTLTAAQLFIEEISTLLQNIFSTPHIQFLVLARTVLLMIEKQCKTILNGKDLLHSLINSSPPKLKELLQILETYKPYSNPSTSSSEISNAQDSTDANTVNNIQNADVNNIQNADVNNIQNTDVNNIQNTDVVADVNTIQNTDVVADVNNILNTDVADVNNAQNNDGLVSDVNNVLFKANESNNNITPNVITADSQNLNNQVEGRINKNEKRSKYPTVCDDGKALCGLIFVHQRIIAYLLSEWLSALKEVNSNFSFLSPSYIIGHGKTNSGAKSISMKFQKQEEVLQKFRTKVYNLVVATSVVEEGMDIPKCNLVIRFDPPENFRAYVQSKGRARVNDSLYVLMVNSKEKESFIDTLCDFKAVEELLLQKCHKADQDMEEPVLEKNIDDIIEPYMPVKEDGCARVTLSSAIALVNRYCAKLPSDTFTRLTPKWKINEDSSSPSTLYQCIMKLPINSPVKKAIEGPWMKSKQLAKMAVALKTCEELHKAGELDDNLLPTGKEAVKSDDLIDDFEEFKKEEDARKGPARPGTTKRRLYYFKRVADALKDSLPVSSSPCFLYVFNMRLTCPIPEEQNTRGRKIHDPSDTVRGFGILTCKPIPPICSFPVFTRSGEVTVTVKPALSSFYLSAEQLENLAFFHRYTFSDVLRLEKYPMLYKPSDSEASFYVVPVTKDNIKDEYVIDWQFADVIFEQRNGRPGKISENERKHFKFVTDDYQDAVVMPWYRNLDKPQFFYVAEICTSLTPKSDFPDLEYETFETYYKKKYNITIMNHDQPLLDVDHTSARLNLLTPRYVNRKGVTLPTSSEQTKRTKRENLQQKQILIPELCTVHPFPAYLWRKAVCLPCILYRLNSLLLAEQLRLLVASSISIGMKHLPENFQWPSLDFGWTLADILVVQNSTKDNKEVKPTAVNNYTKKENLKNGYVSTMNSMNVIENPYNSFEPSVVSNESNNEVMDFEIDVFDPSKLNIPDDDELLEQELMDINFGMGNPFLNSSKSFPVTFGNGTEPVNSYPLWQNIPETDNDEGQPVSRIRYGSPSNFEGSGWDSEWDTEEEESSFLAVNFHGLGYISAPGLINMESLSLDLASCRDDMWDSMDEESIISDDMEEITFTKSVPAIEMNKDNLVKSSKTCEEICEHSWLTCPIIKEECSNMTSEGDDDNDDDISNLLMSVEELKNSKKKEISYLYPEKTKISDVTDCDEIFKTIVQCEQSFTSNSVLCSVESEQEVDTFVHCDKAIPNIPPEEPVLAFGELLPNRDHHHLYDDNMHRVKFDDSPDLSLHPGPSPSIILQALTMSNANDGINLERLETVGDSFLKYAITVYLFCMYPNIHEGKLSYLRSKQISNFNLYKLGKRKCLGELMVASKFEPYDNWLPPNYIVPRGLEEALIESGLPSGCWNLGNLSDLTQMTEDEIRQCIIRKTESNSSEKPDYVQLDSTNPYSLVPYNLLTQHSIPDKSIADCVEALIGAYLVSCGSRGALLFMSWLGLRVLPLNKKEDGTYNEEKYGYLTPPPSPILTKDPKSNLKLEKLLAGYSAFEEKIGYSFNDKSCLLQAFTHASYYYNTLTDCYQRLEFLGDAVLDYLITRHLYEDPKKHSPGTLTDLRSALVNNTFFASLAVKYDFHKFFKAISPGLFNVINKFVLLKENNSGLEDYLQAYYLEEEECEEMEDVEVPKALGDIFESVAGAIYLDSNMSLDTVWRVYYSMMKPEIEYFSNHVPKSPIRELLELEPQTAKFERAEMTVSGKVRVRVDVFGKGQFVGVGRNKRIAKCTAAKHALRELKKNKKI